VPPDHTFGIMVKPDEYGAGDLLHMRGPGQFLRGKDRQRGVLAAIRQHLKKANYHNFQDLLAAFKHYDKVIVLFSSLSLIIESYCVLKRLFKGVYPVIFLSIGFSFI